MMANQRVGLASEYDVLHWVLNLLDCRQRETEPVVYVPSGMPATSLSVKAIPIASFKVLPEVSPMSVSNASVSTGVLRTR
jgi:hypothetical protein